MGSHDLYAQCPVGYASVTRLIKIEYSGICCEVKATYCKKITATGVYVFIQEIVVTEPGCWGIPAGSPPPFSIAYSVRMIRDKIIRDEFPGTIPYCPQLTTITIGVSIPLCGKWTEREIDPDGPGPIPGYLELYTDWCNSELCYRECSVCLDGTDLDPCDQDHPRLFFTCGPLIDPGCPPPPQGQVSECEDLCTSS